MPLLRLITMFVCFVPAFMFTYDVLLLCLMLASLPPYQERTVHLVLHVSGVASPCCYLCVAMYTHPLFGVISCDFYFCPIWSRRWEMQFDFISSWSVTLPCVTYFALSDNICRMTPGQKTNDYGMNANYSSFWVTVSMFGVYLIYC